MAQWSTAFINNLPDSSFAYIETGGKKDSDGKTTPRSLRHLPYKNADGSVDHAHVANALARLNQTQNIPASEKASIRTKLENALKQIKADLEGETERIHFSATSITLDADGNLPTRIPLFVTGNWPNSVKGNFSVDVDDLKEMKDHFDAGIGFPTDDASTGLAIDFEHKWLEKAGAWIKGLELSIDHADPQKAVMYANPVEWTPLGAQKVKDGEYKMISPMGSFGKKNGKLSMWAKATDLKNRLSNVLEGAGLTNAPFLQGMAPIRADKGGDLHSANDNVIYVYDVQQKKERPMNLEALRVEERDALSVPQLDFLAEHKDELSAAELKKFKLETPAEDEHTQLSKEDQDLLTAIKAGDKKVVDASADGADKERLDRMEVTITQYREKEAQALLDSHVKRGAIKQDQAKLDGFWGKQLLSATTEDEAKVVKDALDALPSNEQLAQEIGTGEDVQAGSTPREQLDRLAKEKVDKAAKDGKTLLYSDALKEVYREHADLRTQDSQEQKSKASVLTAGA